VSKSLVLDQSDQFNIYRFVSNPELIFNQEYQTDTFYKEDFRRYFHRSEYLRWRFTHKNGGCPVCNKHTLTFIFFNQNLSKNTELSEITDPDKLGRI
jgi:adenylate cyclase class IV